VGTSSLPTDALPYQPGPLTNIREVEGIGSQYNRMPRLERQACVGANVIFLACHNTAILSLNDQLLSLGQPSCAFVPFPYVGGFQLLMTIPLMVFQETGHPGSTCWAQAQARLVI